MLCINLDGMTARSEAAPGIERRPGLEPSTSSFDAWVRAAPGRDAAVKDFAAFLSQQDVENIIPTEQLLRTATDWKHCGAAEFSVPPRTQWPHIVGTLIYIRDQVKPQIGELRAVSGYRPPALNKCAQGGPRSADLLFSALDLEPLDATINRSDLIERICKIHAASGQKNHIGLGFYAGVRFHIDSIGFRRWGADHHSRTSPCPRTP